MTVTEKQKEAFLLKNEWVLRKSVFRDVGGLFWCDIDGGMSTSNINVAYKYAMELAVLNDTTGIEILKKKLQIAEKALKQVAEIPDDLFICHCAAIVQTALTDIGMLDRDTNNSELRQRLDAQGAGDLANDLLGTLDRKDGEG